ncbi:MAG TPA: hypothetical protein VNN07_15980 [Candidatus Tectomicrobia bacterium]|nr:hypothetical protein [Candidatus Tectomicrobia bacterium]
MTAMWTIGACALFVALLGALVTLVWLNRGSEKVVSAVVSAALSVGIGSLVAVVLAISFSAEPSAEEVFPVSYRYDAVTRMPVRLPEVYAERQFTQMLSAPGQLQARDPRALHDASDPTGTTLYHHLLQRAIIDWLAATYRATWDVEVREFDLPIGRQQQLRPAPPKEAMPARLIGADEIERALAGNRFGRLATPVEPQMVVPPGTALAVTAPARRNGAVEMGEIVLRNEFCRVTIRTEESTWVRSLGALALLTGPPAPEHANAGTATYIVRFRVDFNRWRGGHPRMPGYRRWAGQLGARLRASFSEEEIWRQAKEEFLLRKQAQMSSPTAL